MSASMDVEEMRFIGGSLDGQIKHIFNVTSVYVTKQEEYRKIQYTAPNGAKHHIFVEHGIMDIIADNIALIYLTPERRKEIIANINKPEFVDDSDDDSDDDSIDDLLDDDDFHEVDLRWYQEEAVDALMTYFDESDGHPIVAVPTGAGKTMIMCEFINQYITDVIPNGNALILSHIQEILEQDIAAINYYFGDGAASVYSAGLGSKDIGKITVAGIQSVYRKPELFDDFNIVIIDECHLIQHKSSGMYREFLKHLHKANYVGLTATNYRLGHGYIHKGKEALFTDIAYDLTSRGNYAKLVKEGYLSELVSKATEMDWDLDDVRKRGGDFRTDDLSRKFDRATVTAEAVEEIVRYGKKYKQWLVFAIDIEHAENIADELISHGIPTVCVHSKMQHDRKEIIDEIKRGTYRAVVNVDILTTGFDVPGIDLIAMLRPTHSPVLHVQTIGRGLRVAEGKDHCLVLDFAGNTERLGPIDDIKIRQKGERKFIGEAITKRCPECDTICHPTETICNGCGYEFPIKHNLNSSASLESPMSDVDPDGEAGQDFRDILKKWYPVEAVFYRIHQKPGKPSSLKVVYQCGLRRFYEWICIDHKQGFAKHKADNWVAYRWELDDPAPENLTELWAQRDKLKQPVQIEVDTSGRYPNIVDAHF